MKTLFKIFILTVGILYSVLGFSQVMQMNINSNNQRHSAGSKIISLPDSSSIVVGYTYDLSATTINNPNVLFFKIDKNGTILWQKEIKGTGSSVRTLPSFLKLASNGDILLCVYSQAMTYNNSTPVLYRYTSNGSLRWSKNLRFTDVNGNALHTAGDHIADLVELPDNRLLLVGTYNASPTIASSVLIVLKNTTGTTPPSVQYSEVYDAPSSDGFSSIVSDGYVCYMGGSYYDGTGSANQNLAIWKFHPGSSSTDTSGTILWQRIIDYSAFHPITNSAVNSANSIVNIALRGNKLICNAVSGSDWWSSVSASSELVTLDTNGTNIIVSQFVPKLSHSNSSTIIPVGSSSYINIQSPANKIFDMSTLAIGDGSIVPNTILTRTNLSNNNVSREINLTGNQSIYGAFNEASKLDLVGCNDNDTFKNIYILKTFIDFEDKNPNGCEMSPDTMQIKNVTSNLISKTYNKINSKIYLDYNFTTTTNTPNLSSEIICGSICNFGASISQSKIGANDTLKAHIIGYAHKPTYLWNNGATTSSIAITSSGTYKVTITDSSGCQSIALIKVKIDLSPCRLIKNFSWTNTGNSYTFSINGSLPAGYTATYMWTFGNGQTSTSSKPTTALINNGTYLVRLKYCVRDSSNKLICCDSLMKPVNKSNGAGCGLPCNFLINFGWIDKGSGNFQFLGATIPPASNMYTYLWQFGDGTVSTKSNPSKTFTTNGLHKVCLIVRKWINANNMYCEDSICKNVTVKGVNPCNRFIPDFTWNYSGGLYHVTNTTSLPNLTFVSASYTVSNGTTYNHNNPKIGFNAEGTYSITLTMTVFDVTTGLNCTKSITKTINVLNTICGCFKAKNQYQRAGLNVQFTNASFCTDSMTSYLYKFGDGSTSTQANPNHNYSSPGLYRTVMNITRTIAGITCVDSFVRILQVSLDNPCKDTGVVNAYNYPCPTYLSPVCGCDTITYKNYCEAEKAGVKQYSFGPCSNDTNYVKICGYVYHDMDKDCIVDTTDIGVPGIRIDFNSTPAKSVFTEYNGFFSAYFVKGTYTLTQNISASNSSFPMYQLCPSGSITVAAASPGVYCNSVFYDTSNTCQDLSVKISKIRNLTLGFVSKKRIIYSNNGATPISGVTLHYRFLGALTLNVTTTPSYTVSGNIISWNLGTLAPYSTGYKNVDFNTPVSLALGTTIVDSVWIEPISGDCKSSNNTDTYIDTCVGSYDPNDKQTAQRRYIDTSTKRLDYHIRFQNTGTAPAYNVLVTDILDKNLDINTLKVHASSHKMFYSLDENRQLNFEFQNIMLPDSGTDYEGSQGFISYSIDIKPKLPIGTELNNTAEIFFDFNEAIVTNTTKNTITLKSSSNITNVGPYMNISIYPNPTSNKVIVKVNIEKPSKVSYQIFDINGRLISNVPETMANSNFADEIQFEQFQAGIYILNLIIDGKTTSFKIIKE